jgi:S-adenosylmethionine:tRNA ribosyltransferase-isomerase
MKKHDFDYELPPERIAQRPLENRGASRLLHLPAGAAEPAHLRFSDLPTLLRAGDCLVRNDTRVIPARLIGRKPETGSTVELLLLRRLRGDEWEVLVKPGNRARAGHRISFADPSGEVRMEAEVLEVRETGNRIVRFRYDGIWESLLDALGSMPLPPYIHEKLEDRERYQTVYAVHEGSAAAPTAGLHFTRPMIDQLIHAGIRVVDLTLHVGLGTFRPVKTEDLRDHVMHSEFYDLPEATAKAVNDTRRAGGRIVAVGTTVCRVLEAVAAEDGTVEASRGWTDIFLYPGCRFKTVDLLLTNFHLPESTLLMLVSAFAGRERILSSYREAIDREYRFFSFGDCMLLERDNGPRDGLPQGDRGGAA